MTFCMLSCKHGFTADWEVAAGIKQKADRALKKIERKEER